MNRKKVITFYPQAETKETANEGPKLRAAAYCRVSTESSQQLHSVKAQVEYYRQMISSNAGY